MTRVLLLFLGFDAYAATQDLKLKDICIEQMAAIPGDFKAEEVQKACETVEQLPGCESVDKVPIFHYDRIGLGKSPKRILAISLIHGDETRSGSVGRAWMTRLMNIDPRNTWRVIVLANPDGYKLKSRMNRNGVDLNRNFPTKDWDEKSLDYWKTRMKSDPRRNPGPSAASEIETRCLVRHIDEFNPQFVISVHTPLGVLDFDGPRVKPPRFRPLPWTSLGNFPGSLGRYMWVDKKVPVLTIELKADNDVKKLEAFDQLQDISGTVAIQADQLMPATKTKE